MSGKTDKPRHPGYKRWFTLYLILALIVHAGVFYFFTFELDDPPKLSSREGFLYYLPEELPTATQELEQRAFLFDSEPLFLPTTRNFSGPIKTDASVWEPSVSLSEPFDPDIRWDDSLLLMEGGAFEGSDTPMALLEPVARDFISEFGAQPRLPSQSTPPGLFVEAKTTGGFLILKTFIEFSEAAEVEFPRNPEFAVLHTGFGLAGAPLLIRPSGNEATDNFVRDFILKKVNPLLLGSNGYFHIRIGL